MRFAAVVAIALLGCTDHVPAATPSSSGPEIFRLQAQAGTVTAYGTPQGLRFDVHDPSGQLQAQNVDIQQLRASHRHLAELMERGYASPHEPFLDARAP